MMSFLAKYLLELELTDKIYSLSVLNKSEAHFLTVSDKKFKNKEMIKENVEIQVSATYLDSLDEDNNIAFNKKEINTDSENAYCSIVEYLKECLPQLGLDFKEELFDFAEIKNKNSFKYEISKNESLFIKAEINGEKIY